MSVVKKLKKKYKSVDSLYDSYTISVKANYEYISKKCKLGTKSNVFFP